MRNLSFGYSYVNLHLDGFEQILDEEFGILVVQTPDVNKMMEVVPKMPHSDLGPCRLGRVINPMHIFTYDGYVAHHAYIAKVVQDVKPTFMKMLLVM